MIRSSLIAPILLIIVSPAAHAAFSLPTAGITYRETFEAFTGAGFSPTPTTGQLDSNTWIVTGLSDGMMTFGDTRTTGDFARGDSNGGVSTGGVYAFEVTATTMNRGLGVQPAGSDFTPGSFFLKIENTSGSAFSGFDASYLRAVRNDQSRANSFDWGYLVSSSNLTSTELGSSTFTLLDAYTSPEAANASGSPPWSTTNVAAPTQTTTIDPGQFIYMRWFSDDVSGSGSRDEFAIADFSITPLAAAAPVSAVPVPPTVLFGIVGLVGMAAVRRRRAAA